MPALDTSQWALVLLALVLVGYAKTGLAGVGVIAVALFAVALPARQSTGALLPLLLFGDVLAVSAYRRHTQWPTLWRLFPWVGAGTAVGALLVHYADDTQMRRLIGVCLLVVLAGSLRRLEVATVAGLLPLVGLLAGVMTMVANAAGPLMSVYLLAAGLPVLAFLGTAAWFFLVVNLFKVPFSIGLGLITPTWLLFAVVTAPAVAVGAALGRLTATRINRVLFERLTMALTFVAAVRLLLV